MGSVFITGASRGIGKSIFEAFAKDGHTVYGTSTTCEGVAVIENIIDNFGCDHGCLSGDLVLSKKDQEAG